MSLSITCPLPAAIGDITPVTCAENFGQIVKIAFQRTGNTFTDITDETEWDTALAASDATKISITPFCENVLIPAGELITEGGDDNTTLFGQPIAVGKGSIQPTGRFRGLPAQTKRDLEKYIAEASVYGNLGVYLINEFGQVIGSESTKAVTADPFPISNFFISDVDSQGFNTNNFNNFSWTFRGGWSDNFSIYDLGWDILSK